MKRISLFRNDFRDEGVFEGTFDELLKELGIPEDEIEDTFSIDLVIEDVSVS